MSSTARLLLESNRRPVGRISVGPVRFDNSFGILDVQPVLTGEKLNVIIRADRRHSLHLGLLISLARHRANPALIAIND